MPKIIPKRKETRKHISDRRYAAKRRARLGREAYNEYQRTLMRMLYAQKKLAKLREKNNKPQPKPKRMWEGWNI